MKLIRLGPSGAERPHLLLEDGRVVDVGDEVGDFDPAFFARGDWRICVPGNRTLP